MHDDGTFYSRGAVVNEQEFDIMRRVMVNELAREMTLLSFKQELCVLVESGTTSHLIVDGQRLKEGETHNDWYGFLTSCQEHLARDKKTRPADSGVVEEIITTITFRFCARAEKVGGGLRPQYRYIPDDWIILNHENSEANVRKWFETPFPESISLAPKFYGRDPRTQQFLVWSSKNTPEENRALYEALIIECINVNALGADDLDKYMSEYDKNVGALV